MVYWDDGKLSSTPWPGVAQRLLVSENVLHTVI